jgi:N6-L-threonylcarbamoyladenine synthase
VGVTYAKALAFALEKPLIAVNHLEGHIHAVLLDEKQRGNRDFQFPVLALVVSGGHTHLYLCDLHRQNGREGWTYKLVGRTRDDAAGEAYDKVAKLLGLGYPGGPVIDKLAKHGNPDAIKFPPAQIKGPDRARRAEERTSFDFSFSGIKTAVLRHVETHNMLPVAQARRQKISSVAKPKAEDYLELCDKPTLDLVASFQRRVVDDLVGKTLKAANELRASTLFVTGGVAANSELRQRFEERAAKEGLPVYFPSRPLSTDNAAMIAAAAYPKFLAGAFAEAEFSAEASLSLV